MNWSIVIYGLICLIIGHIWGCLSKAGEIKKLRDYAAKILALANAELRLLDEMKAHIDELERQIDASNCEPKEDKPTDWGDDSCGHLLK